MRCGSRYAIVHAPARNISLARNACLEESRADFVAFIDDDESCDARVAAAVAGDERYGRRRCGARSGPCAVWRRCALLDAERRLPLDLSGNPQARDPHRLYCNVLLRTASKSIAGRRFDLERGRSGGEDTAYFAKVADDGGRIAYAAEAWVEEPVITERASLSWLAKRRFRVGQTHGRLLAEYASAWSRAKAVGLAGSKAAFCFAAAAATAYSAVRRNRYLLRGIMHTGVVGGLLGQRELNLYGAAVPGREGVT